MTRDDSASGSLPPRPDTVEVTVNLRRATAVFLDRLGQEMEVERSQACRQIIDLVIQQVDPPEERASASAPDIEGLRDRLLAQALDKIFQAGLPAGWSEQCSSAVDGLGTSRVSAILMLDSQTPLRARPARLDDEAIILHWANDSLVRKNAFRPGAIDPDTHRAWFRERVRHLDSCRIYILETSEGFPVGQVRFEQSAEGWEIDYALDPLARGRHLGKALLKTALLALSRDLKNALLLGRVKRLNVPSRKVFEALGFVSRIGRDGEIIYNRVL